MRWWELTKLTVVIISQYIHRSNHYTVHPKLIQTFYINYMWIKPGRDYIWEWGLSFRFVLFSFDLHFKASGWFFCVAKAERCPFRQSLFCTLYFCWIDQSQNQNIRKIISEKLTLSIHNQFLGTSQVLIRVKYFRF